MTSLQSRLRPVPRTAWWIINLSLAALFLYPFWVVLSQSIKSPAEAAAAPPTLFPGSFSWGNFAKLFGNENGGAGFVQQLGNSVLVSVGATLLTPATASPNCASAAATCCFSLPSPPS